MVHKWWRSLQPGLQPLLRKTCLHQAPSCFKQIKFNSGIWSWATPESREIITAWSGALHMKNSHYRNTTLRQWTHFYASVSPFVNVLPMAVGRWKWCFKLFFNFQNLCYYSNRIQVQSLMLKSDPCFYMLSLEHRNNSSSIQFRIN